MKELPKQVLDAWTKKEGPVVFTTVSSNSIPNSIYVTCVAIFNTQSFVIANNYFVKTKLYIESNNTASVLFITVEGVSFQVKGKLVYHTHGVVFDFMKSWNPEKNPGNAAVELVPEQIFSGAKQIF